MSWLLIIFINVVAISLASLFQRLAMRQENSDPLLSSIFFQFLLGVVVLSFAIINGFVWPDWSATWPLFLFSAVLYAFGTLLFFKSIKLIEASEMIVFGGAGSVITMFCAYFFLGERLNVIQYAGAALVVSAILLIASQGKKIVFSRGALLALLGNSFFAIAVISDTLVIRTYDAISFAGLMSIMPAIVLSVVYPRKLLQLPAMVKKIDKNLVIYTLLYAAGVVSFYGALGTGAMISQVSVVSRSNIILTVLLAAIFLKERSGFWKKFLAALLCTIGVMLVA
jgi:uncharacterized membrane protein